MSAPKSNLARTVRTESWMVEHRWPTATTTLAASSEAQAHKLAALFADKGIPATVLRVVTTINYIPLPAPDVPEEPSGPNKINEES